MLMNVLAKDTAESSVSPTRPTMMVSIMLTPTVIRLCMAMGTATTATVL